MAMVWAARLKGSRGFQKIVAVKTMLPKLSEDPQFEKMFLDEASLASRIHHPNVVEVLDLGEQDGVLFIAMEWLDGVPLNQVMKAAKVASGIPIPVAIHILTHAAEGLNCAHDLRDDRGTLVGLVHRDVSPQNILVGYDGFTKMVDFGLAKATALGDGATRAGQLKGKISYMAPEQIKGEMLDRRADVFALGVVLYAVTTGKHPFRRESEGATLFAISAPDPAPAPSRYMAYPADLEAVLMKAIAKDPNQRFSSALDFARALEATLPESERAHGGERVGVFLKELLGKQHDDQRAALLEALRRADRASISPSNATLEGLSAPGASGVSSLSGVGVTRTSQDHVTTPDFPATGIWPRFRLPIAIVTLATLGGLAYALTRDPEQPKPAAIPPTAQQPATPVQSAPATAETPPAEASAEPAASASASTEPAAADTAAPAERTGRQPPRQVTPPPTPPPRSKRDWKQDPGF
jgi:serine/threonine-protein kinase